MIPQLVAIGIVIAAAFAVFKRTVTTADTVARALAPTLQVLYATIGRQQGINPRLLRAVAQVESNERVLALNTAERSQGKAATSYGLMQILCVPDGRGSCSNRLNCPGWPPARATDLLEPSFNLALAACILRWNLDKFGFPRGVAMYNAFGARLDPPRGPFRNQGYVNKVLAAFDALGGGRWDETRPEQTIGFLEEGDF